VRENSVSLPQPEFDFIPFHFQQSGGEAGKTDGKFA